MNLGLSFKLHYYLIRSNNITFVAIAFSLHVAVLQAFAMTLKIYTKEKCRKSLYKGRKVLLVNQIMNLQVKN